MSQVAVAMTVYNDAQHLRKAIESVLRQDFTDLDLYIFDNHSPDPAVGEIITDVCWRLAPRVICVSVPEGLQGIGLMRFWWEYLKGRGQRFTITLGGHDVWDGTTFLSTLVNLHDVWVPPRQRTDYTLSLIFADTWQINEQDQPCGKYHDIHQFVGEGHPAILPQKVVTTVNSPQLFGLWNERVRERLSVRHLCSGWDHLVVTEAATMGHILFAGAARLYMRALKADDSLVKYGLRHLTDAQRAAGMRDFCEQIEWLHYILEGAFEKLPPAERPMHRTLLGASMISTYIAMRGYNLQIVPGALAQFQNDPAVNALFGRLNEVAALYAALAEKGKPVT